MLAGTSGGEAESIKAPASIRKVLGRGPSNITYSDGVLFFEDGTDMEAPKEVERAL